MPTSSRSMTSPKVTALLQVLIDGREHSTWELSRRAELCDAATLVRELRNYGLAIPREQRGTNHWYRLSAEDFDLLAELRPDLRPLLAHYRPPQQVATHAEATK